MVGIKGKPARPADELRLGSAVRLGDIATMRASLRGVFWANEKNGQTNEPCFVNYKLGKFAEGPFMMSIPLALSHFGSLQDPFQVFKGYTSSGIQSLVHNTPTDKVIDRAFEPSLPARNPSEVPFGRVSAFLLKLTPQPIIAISVFFHSLATELFSIGSSSKIDNTKVDSQITLNSLGW